MDPVDALRFNLYARARDMRGKEKDALFWGEMRRQGDARYRRRIQEKIIILTVPRSRPLDCRGGEGDGKRESGRRIDARW